MTSKTISKERLEWIDALKGLAMSLVILGHITQKYYNFDFYPQSTQAIGVLYRLIYSFHMPLFMMISCYLFNMAYITSEGEVKRDRLKVQFLNLLIVYALFSIVEGGVKLLFSKDVITPVQPIDLLLIFFKPIGGRMWYLYALLEYYVLFSLKPIRKNIGKWWLLAAIVVISILSVFSSYDWWFTFRRSIRDLLPFYVGILLNRCGMDEALRNKILVVISVAVIFVRVLFYSQGEIRNEIPADSVLYGTVVALWIVIAFQRFGILSTAGVVNAIGLNSLEMFIFQEYPLTVGTKMLPRVIGNPWISMIICFVFTVLTVFVTSWVMNKMRLHNVFFKPYSQIVVEKRLIGSN